MHYLVKRDAVQLQCDKVLRQKSSPALCNAFLDAVHNSSDHSCLISITLGVEGPSLVQPNAP